MLIGEGFVAGAMKRFKDKSDVLIFASGVSNSNEKRELEFKMEFDLVEKTLKENRKKLFIYFSTTSVIDDNKCHKEYITHKKHIEDYILLNAARYIIFRVSQLVGKSDNPNTIMNYLFHCIKDQIKFTLWKESDRNLLDIEDMTKITGYIIDHSLFINNIVNIANPFNIKTLDLVIKIERFLQKTAIYSISNQHSSYKINIDQISPIIESLNFGFGENYIERLLIKYYL